MMTPNFRMRGQPPVSDLGNGHAGLYESGAVAMQIAGRTHRYLVLAEDRRSRVSRWQTFWGCQNATL